MANVSQTSVEVGDRAASHPRPDFATTVFTSLTAGVFVILIGCLATAAVLFGQGL